MAQYKVPQDVEADDKLLGPFSFRQFVYLLIAGGLIALAFGLGAIFPLLAVIPIPFILFFIILALPLKKDQPMETYLAALVSYYLKPRKRLWKPGQRESTILITAPKIIEKPLARNITEEEASHQLSFLSEIIDTGGQAIKNNSPMRDEFAAEANNIVDMFDNVNSIDLDQKIIQDTQNHHSRVLAQMRNTINQNSPSNTQPAEIQKHNNQNTAKQPSNNIIIHPAKKTQPKSYQNPTKPSIIDLANNQDFSIETIQKEANRINKTEPGEVYIALH